MLFSLVLVVCFVSLCGAFSGDYYYTPMKPPVPTEGIPWPLPQILSLGGSNLTLDPDSLQMQSNSRCVIVSEALDRYRGILLTEKGKPIKNGPSTRHNHNTRTQNPSEVADTDLTILNVLIDQNDTCDQYPYLGMNEAYQLTVYENGTAQLTSQTIWGALRGLETFSQLTFVKMNASGNVLKIRTAFIEDWPRFSHRGILLDTSRHYVSPKIIKQNLDVMAHAKYNVFHWHIVDDQSFPYQSDVYPNLSGKAAYTPKHVYTKKIIAEIIEYARLRGIRVMPEFDSPGHTMSWGQGYPEIMTRCYSEGRYSPDYGVINPAAKVTYDFMLNLFTEVLQRFPDQYVHLGGDEVFFDCWESNMDIELLMRKLRVTASNVTKVEEYYMQKLVALIEQARSTVSYVVWQEVFDNGVKVKPDTVIHVWMGNTQLDIDREMYEITKKNYRTILSSCWYLNYIKYQNNWTDYYECDPQHFSGTEQQKALVMGGEACMWGEWIDGTNLIPTLWPMASVVAERLWSAKEINDVTKAKPRLEEHRCRLVRRGYPASPVNGVGYCPVEWDE